MSKADKKPAPLCDLVSIRMKKKERIAALGLSPYSNTFHPSCTARELKELYGSVQRRSGGEAGALNDLNHAIAGRVLTIRSFGKASFFHLLDHTGSIQVYVRKDRISEKDFSLWGEVDAGDFIGVEGGMFHTKTGELTLMAEKIHFITKAIRPLPEKWHGLVDPETRYRQRYLDLLSNPGVKEIFIVRSLVIRCLRDYLTREGFMEVETPMLHPLRGGAIARPFVTHHQALGMDLYLRIAPELYLKRLLVGGFGKVFEIGKAFRNEGVSAKHNPEFTILEFYEAFADSKRVLERTEEMIKEVEQRLHEHLPHLREKRPYDLQAPWKKVRMAEAIAMYGGNEGVDAAVVEEENLARTWYSRNLAPGERNEEATHGEIVQAMFERIVEPRMGKEPIVVLDFPADTSPLSRRKDSDPRWADRFELYLDGREIVNAFSELNDPAAQAKIFEAQAAARSRGDEEAMDHDHDFITALEHGMPPAGGFGLGVDRLVMSLCQAESIREVIIFPAMRPEREP